MRVVYHNFNQTELYNHKCIGQIHCDRLEMQRLKLKNPILIVQF